MEERKWSLKQEDLPKPKNDRTWLPPKKENPLDKMNAKFRKKVQEIFGFANKNEADDPIKILTERYESGEPFGSIRKKLEVNSIGNTIEVVGEFPKTLSPDELLASLSEDSGGKYGLDPISFKKLLPDLYDQYFLQIAQKWAEKLKNKQ